MSFSKDYSIHFEHNNINYNISLVEGVKSDLRIVINGVVYSVLADEEQLKFTKQIFNSISLDSIVSIEDLSDRIEVWKKESSKLESVAQKVLPINFQSNESIDKNNGALSKEKSKQKDWKDEEHLSQLTERKREVLAEKMLARAEKNKESVEGLLKIVFALDDIQCNEVLKDKIKFKKLFYKENITKETLDNIVEYEKVDHFPSAHTINSRDIINLERHIKDTEFSGVIGIFDGKSTHFVMSENQSSLDVPFPIHSIGKTFTGVLALKMIEESDKGEKLLDEPINSLLEKEVIAQLPLKIQRYLKEEKPSLKQVMLHTSGLGDYLGNYQDAIDIALLVQKELTINNPEDLLKIAQNELFQVNTFNLGLLSLAYLQKGTINEKILDEQIDIISLEGKIDQNEYNKFLEIEKPITLRKIMEVGLSEKLEGFKNKGLSQIPQMGNTEDFLLFADDSIYKMDEFNYSNLGILLLGLAVKHQYNLKHNTTLSYNDILKSQIEEKAGVKIYQKKPEHVGFKDEGISHIYGSPSGGQWMSAEDLLKFGQWVKSESKNSRFLELLRNHGGEFFFENNEVRHHGDTPSASSSFSTFLDEGMPSIVILSDSQKTVSGQAAKKMYLSILDNLFPEKR